MRSFMRSFMRSPSWLLLLVLLPIPVHGQDPALEAFDEVIDVRVLNLEVAVRDKDGFHVEGLTPADFRLTVDGAEVPIEYFSEIRQGAATDVPPAATIAGNEVDSGVVPTVKPGEAVGNSILLFIDNYFGFTRDRRIVLENLIDGLDELGPKDRMAVVAFDGRQLDLVGNWEGSPRALERTLREAIDMPAAGLERRAELAMYGLQLRAQGSGLVREGQDNIRVEYIRVLSRQVETVVKAATTAMRTLAMPPGRKVMLLTSGGWPGDPSIYAAGLNPDIRNRTKRFSPRPALEDLAATANVLGYTIYPIDLEGRRNVQRINAGNLEAVGVGFTQAVPTTTPAGPGGPGEADPPPPPEDVTIQQMDAVLAEFEAVAGREQLIEAPLITLAKETGGEPMLNSFRRTALQRTLEDTGSYYWLGYTPARARDDAPHKVKVEVLKKGVKSRSRRSFRDLSRQAEVTMMVESNLLFSTDLRGHSLEAELGEPTKKRGKLSLPVTLKIPMDELLMLPVAGGFQATLELRVAVLDKKGNRSEIPVIPVILKGETEPPPGAHAVYDTELKLRDIEQRLALALYDVAGEKILSTSIELDPDSL